MWLWTLELQQVPAVVEEGEMVLVVVEESETLKQLILQ